MGNHSSELRQALQENRPLLAKKILLKAGPDSGRLIDGELTSNTQSCCFRNDHSFLHSAVHHKNAAIFVPLFLDFGADIHIPGVLGRTPLHRATMRNDVGLSKLLLSRGADIYLRDNSGMTPLHCAAHSLFAKRAADVSMLELLLEYSDPDDVHLVDNYGETPVHKATRTGFWGAVDFMMQHGGDMYRENSDGQTPVDVAVTWLKDYLMDPERGTPEIHLETIGDEDEY